jgi:hypothetical protein
MIVMALGLVSIPLTGCKLASGFFMLSYNTGRFFGTTPFIPVTAYMSQRIEDRYHDEEYYKKVPVLDPVEGENAPIFCLDPPSPDHVMRALPDETSGGVYFLAETQRNNVKMVIEPIVDKLDDCRFYPMVGPARMHHCHYKCTVYYDKTIRSFWPVPFTHTDQTEQVVYIDKDHLIRCSGGPSN